MSLAGGPDRSQPGLRRRAAVELATVSGLTALFLALVPGRPAWVDVGLALLALALIGLSSGETRRRFWGAPPGRRTERLRRSAVRMLGLSLPVVFGFAVYTMLARPTPEGTLAYLFRPAALRTFALFVPWALVQQTLFQFYLQGRLRALLGGGSPIGSVMLTGLGYGAVHLPDRELALLTAAAGIVWSWAYQRDRVLLPVALSHALLGTTYFAWVRGQDLLPSAPLGGP